MSQVTYAEALATIIETTEMGYTIKSQDKLWTVFIFDTWSTGEYAEMKYNRIYFCERPNTSGYDIFDDTLFWTRRHEAEAFAEVKRIEYATEYPPGDRIECPKVYVINWGDDTRFEHYVLSMRKNLDIKFKGSEEAIKAMTDMHWRWRDDQE